MCPHPFDFFPANCLVMSFPLTFWDRPDFAANFDKHVSVLVLRFLKIQCRLNDFHSFWFPFNLFNLLFLIQNNLFMLMNFSFSFRVFEVGICRQRFVKQIYILS